MKYVLYGVKGSGMSSVCHILLDKGYEVIGIDTNNYVYTQDDLIKRNVKSPEARLRASSFISGRQAGEIIT